MSSSNKLVIFTEKNQYSPGEMIKGNVQIFLQSPMRCSDLSLDFYGEKKESSSDGSYTKRTDMISQSLVDEKMFQSGEQKNFSITIPPNISTKSSGGFLGLFKSSPKYFLQATLFVVNGGSIHCKNQLKIIPKS
jgi:hypothetical protein